MIDTIKDFSQLQQTGVVCMLDVTFFESYKSFGYKKNVTKSMNIFLAKVTFVVINHEDVHWYVTLNFIVIIFVLTIILLYHLIIIICRILLLVFNIIQKSQNVSNF
jgi:hypothetical protein